MIIIIINNHNNNNNNRNSGCELKDSVFTDPFSSSLTQTYDNTHGNFNFT